MIVILCLDEAHGMRFHERRQSRDSVLIQNICELSRESRLWMNTYSSKLFGNLENLMADKAFLWKSAVGEYCFVESNPLKEVEERIEQIIVFWWNRRYPADFYLDINLAEWKCLESSDFSGSSHKRITKEVYGR